MSIFGKDPNKCDELLIVVDHDLEPERYLRDITIGMTIQQAKEVIKLLQGFTKSRKALFAGVTLSIGTELWPNPILGDRASLVSLQK